jgi:hypothetical protein
MRLTLPTTVSRSTILDTDRVFHHSIAAIQLAKKVIVNIIVKPRYGAFYYKQGSFKASLSRVELQTNKSPLFSQQARELHFKAVYLLFC